MHKSKREHPLQEIACLEAKHFSFGLTLNFSNRAFSKATGVQLLSHRIPNRIETLSFCHYCKRRGEKPSALKGTV